jgi:hypothetical protein
MREPEYMAFASFQTVEYKVAVGYKDIAEMLLARK